MIENKRSFLTFPHIGVHISNSILNLISQEDSEGQIDDKVLTSVDNKDSKKDDASKINDEEDHG